MLLSLKERKRTERSEWKRMQCPTLLEGQSYRYRFCHDKVMHKEQWEQFTLIVLYKRVIMSDFLPSLLNPNHPGCWAKRMHTFLLVYTDTKTNDTNLQK